MLWQNWHVAICDFVLELAIRMAKVMEIMNVEEVEESVRIHALSRSRVHALIRQVFSRSAVRHSSSGRSDPALWLVGGRGERVGAPVVRQVRSGSAAVPQCRSEFGWVATPRPRDCVVRIHYWGHGSWVATNPQPTFPIRFRLAVSNRPPHTLRQAESASQ